MKLMSRSLMFLRSLFSARTRRVAREIGRLKRMINMVGATGEAEIIAEIPIEPDFDLNQFLSPR